MTKINFFVICKNSFMVMLMSHFTISVKKNRVAILAITFLKFFNLNYLIIINDIISIIRKLLSVIILQINANSYI